MRRNLTVTADGTVFAVFGVGSVGQQRFVDTSLVVRLERNAIVLGRNVNTTPLIDALLAAGIPRSQIVLGYAGESSHAAVPSRPALREGIQRTRRPG